MFEKVKKMVNSMFRTTTVEEALGIELSVSEQMLNAQLLWRTMIQGKAEWNDKDTPSLQIANGICVEIARSVALEFESKLTGSKRADYLDVQYQNLIDNSRSIIEKMCAGGEVILKPYPKGKEIKTMVVENKMYWPVEYNSNGELTRVVFGERIKKDSLFYILFEEHNWNETTNEYEMKYKAYTSEDGFKLKKEITPSSMQFWKEIKDMNFKNIYKPLFVVLRNPQSNTIDMEAEQGISSFAKAVELIKEADKQFGRIIWEFEGGELAINASIDLFKKDRNTNKPALPKGKDRLYKTYDVDATTFALDVFNPEYRDSSLYNGLDKILKKIEFVCQLSYGTISDPQSIEKTATEIKTAKQRFYSLVSDIQSSYRLALEKLINSYDVLATLYKLAPNGEVESSFSFDDSIIVDRETELNQKLALAGAGILNGYEVRAWYLGQTEEEAKKGMPDMEKMLEEENIEE